MRKSLLCSLVALYAPLGGLAAPPQAVLKAPSPGVDQLHGRFLHISDMHPDPHYKSGASQSSGCHRKKPKDERRSGYYGTPFSECDSPFSLTNFTFDFLDEHWSDEIDFVIWTGDNARHDNDEELPRTLDEIYDLNRVIAGRMEEVFLRKGIPVVPSLGNNDISPHNILAAGPNEIIDEFSLIWKPFIPSVSYPAFRQGAYFSVEVIPDAVAVISLNTMYFFNSNKAVGGCQYKDPHDPGNLEFDWLEEQLDMYRSRHMHVWVTGHVPPSADNYFSECYYRFTELSLRFQDTILGNLFGHKNADHFFFIEADDLLIGAGDESVKPSITKNTNLFETLITDFSQLPAPLKKVNYDEYAVVNVNPSVVPNPYLPSFRVFAYNVTEISSLFENVHADKEDIKIAGERKRDRRHGNPGKEASECSTEPYRDSWRCRLGEPWHSDRDAPSRRNKLWSPLGYAQYYLPKLDEYNERRKPKFKLEYLTFPISALHPWKDRDGGGGKTMSATPPIPLRNLPKALRSGDVTESKYAPYGMADLTIPSWIELGQRLGNEEEKKLRKRFRKYMYMGGEEG